MIRHQQTHAHNVSYSSPIHNFTWTTSWGIFPYLLSLGSYLLYLVCLVCSALLVLLLVLVGSDVQVVDVDVLEAHHH